MYACRGCFAEYYCCELHYRLNAQEHVQRCAQMKVLSAQSRTPIPIGGHQHSRHGEPQLGDEELLLPCSLNRTLTERDFPAIKHAFDEALGLGFRVTRNVLGPQMQCNPIGAYYMVTHNVLHELHLNLQRSDFILPAIESIGTVFTYQQEHTHHDGASPMPLADSRSGDTPIATKRDMALFDETYDQCFDAGATSIGTFHLPYVTVLETDACALADYVNKLLFKHLHHRRYRR